VADENQVSDDAGNSASSGGGLLGAIFSGASKIWNAVTADGYWQRQAAKVSTSWVPRSKHSPIPFLWMNRHSVEPDARRDCRKTGNFRPSARRTPGQSEIAQEHRNQPAK